MAITISTGQSTTDKHYGVEAVREWAVLGNGYDPNLKWDGMAAAADLLGYPTPTKPNAAITAAGRMMKGKYSYVLFYERKTTVAPWLTDCQGRYGAPSVKTYAFIPADGGSVVLTNIPISTEAQVSHILIGRTLADNEDTERYFKVAEITNGTVTYTDIKDDAELSLELDVDNYRLLPASLFAAWKTRLFAAGILGDSEHVAISKIDNFESFPPLDVVRIPSVTALKAHRGVMLAFQEEGIKEISGLDDADVSTFTVRDLGVSAGTKSPKSVKGLNDLLFFYSTKPLGIFVLTAENTPPQRISATIDNILKSVDLSDPATVRAEVRKSPPQYWLWLTQKGSPVINNLLLVFDLRTSGWYIDLSPGHSNMCTLTEEGGKDRLYSVEGAFGKHVLEDAPAGIIPVAAGGYRYFTSAVASALISSVTIADTYFDATLHTGSRIRILSGLGAGQAPRVITSVVSTTNATIAPSWVVIPNATSVVEVLPAPFRLTSRAHIIHAEALQSYKKFIAQFVEIGAIAPKSEVNLGYSNCYADYFFPVYDAGATLVRVVSPVLVVNGLVGKYVEVVSGRGFGQRRIIISNTIDGVITISPNFDITPDNTSEIAIRSIYFSGVRNIDRPVLRGTILLKCERLVFEWEGRAVFGRPQFTGYSLLWLPKEKVGG